MLLHTIGVGRGDIPGAGAKLGDDLGIPAPLVGAERGARIGDRRDGVRHRLVSPF